MHVRLSSFVLHQACSNLGHWPIYIVCKYVLLAWKHGFIWGINPFFASMSTLMVMAKNVFMITGSNKLEKESHFVGTNDDEPWSSFMFPNDRNIKWTQLQSKHGICPKLGALGKYFQFILMNKSITNWNYLFAGIEQRLIQQSASTSS